MKGLMMTEEMVARLKEVVEAKKEQYFNEMHDKLDSDEKFPCVQSACFGFYHAGMARAYELISIAIEMGGDEIADNSKADPK
ncbi:MAG: hypothetical protein ACRDD8_15940 [Bacteroidales bacterium]